MSANNIQYFFSEIKKNIFIAGFYTISVSLVVLYHPGSGIEINIFAEKQMDWWDGDQSEGYGKSSQNTEELCESRINIQPELPMNL